MTRFVHYYTNGRQAEQDFYFPLGVYSSLLKDPSQGIDRCVHSGHEQWGNVNQLRRQRRWMLFGQNSISHPINSLTRLRWDFREDKMGWMESYAVIDGDKGRCGVSTAAYWEGRMSYYITWQDHKNIISLFFPISVPSWRKQKCWWMRLQDIDIDIDRDLDKLCASSGKSQRSLH